MSDAPPGRGHIFDIEGEFGSPFSTPEYLQRTLRTGVFRVVGRDRRVYIVNAGEFGTGARNYRLTGDCQTHTDYLSGFLVDDLYSHAQVFLHPDSDAPVVVIQQAAWTDRWDHPYLTDHSVDMWNKRCMGFHIYFDSYNDIGWMGARVLHFRIRASVLEGLYVFMHANKPGFPRYGTSIRVLILNTDGSVAFMLSYCLVEQQVVTIYDVPDRDLIMLLKTRGERTALDRGFDIGDISPHRRMCNDHRVTLRTHRRSRASVEYHKCLRDADSEIASLKRRARDKTMRSAAAAAAAPVAVSTRLASSAGRCALPCTRSARLVRSIRASDALDPVPSTLPCVSVLTTSRFPLSALCDALLPDDITVEIHRADSHPTIECDDDLGKDVLTCLPKCPSPLEDVKDVEQYL